MRTIWFSSFRTSSGSDAPALCPVFFLHNGNEYDLVVNLGRFEHNVDSGMSTHSLSKRTTRSSLDELPREGDWGGVIMVVTVVEMEEGKGTNGGVGD